MSYEAAWHWKKKVLQASRLSQNLEKHSCNLDILNLSLEIKTLKICCFICDKVFVVVFGSSSVMGIRCNLQAEGQEQSEEHCANLVRIHNCDQLLGQCKASTSGSYKYHRNASKGNENNFNLCACLSSFTSCYFFLPYAYIAAHKYQLN